MKLEAYRNSIKRFMWTILGSLDEMDLTPFYGAYRPDGDSRPTYNSRMMVAPLLYAYSRGNRSSRAIERECREDLVYMVFSAQRAPDHSTIWRREAELCVAMRFSP